MCRTVQVLLQTVVCAVQMVVRMVMTVVLMVESMLRLVLQSVYNCVSVVLQVISLLPICLVFLITSRLKCLVCGGGGCPMQRGGVCDCFLSILFLVLLFFILRATGQLDKLMAMLGYSKNK